MNRIARFVSGPRDGLEMALGFSTPKQFTFILKENGKKVVYGLESETADSATYRHRPLPPDCQEVSP